MAFSLPILRLFVAAAAAVLRSDLSPFISTMAQFRRHFFSDCVLLAFLLFSDFTPFSIPAGRSGYPFERPFPLWYFISFFPFFLPPRHYAFAVATYFLILLKSRLPFPTVITSLGPAGPATLAPLSLVSKPKGSYPVSSSFLSIFPRNPGFFPSAPLLGPPPPPFG